MSLTNIDDLLNAVPMEPEPIATSDTSDATEFEPEIKPIEKIPEPESSVTEAEVETDDYGSPVEKKEKTYTEAEVQEMIRRRVKEKHEQPIVQPQEMPANTDGDNWESQLESFVEQTLTKREQKMQEQSWQQQQAQQQAEFEIKFNSGAAKYPDFESVVMGKSLTPQMVIATRGMDNPAAFIYAAAKTQSGELDRIAKISDPYSQAVELGKLEERMKKGKTSVSNAPRPIETPRGDVVEKKNKNQNIDDKLLQVERDMKKARR